MLQVYDARLREARRGSPSPAPAAVISTLHTHPWLTGTSTLLFFLLLAFYYFFPPSSRRCYLLLPPSPKLGFAQLAAGVHLV